MSMPREQRLPIPRIVSHLIVMIAVAGVLGVVVAGLAIPFAGIVGVGARNVSRSIDDLPADLETDTLSQKTRVTDANGKLLATLYYPDANRTNVPLTKVSRIMAKAIVSIEDYRFYQHGALDLKGTLRAFVTNQANNGTVQGGSSITQQLVKQTLVDQAKTAKQRKAATDDSYARKLNELRYAIALEQKHTKDWILERYLNIAYFGDGAYGIQSAAKHFFNVNAAQLDLRQAAMLAGLVKSPEGYNPTAYPDRAVARRNVVLDRMAQLNVITPKHARKIGRKALGLDVQPKQNGCVSTRAQFFCDYVVNYLEADRSLGKTVKARDRLIFSGGLTIRTTVDMRDQRAAQASLKSHVYATDQAIGGLAMIEPRTGNVKALAQSRPMGADVAKGQTYLNYVVPQQYGDSAGFQAGSTFKPFVLATAINDDIPLSTTIFAPDSITLPQSTFANCPGAPAFVGEYPASNSTGSGNFTLYTGTQQSVNTFYLQLEQMTGVCDPFNLAKAMGIELTNPTGDQYGNGAERVPSFTLGIPGVSPLEMAEAYATFGGRGLHCDARPVTKILDRAGNTIKDYPSQCTQVMPESTADGVNDVLRGVQEPGGFGYDIGNTNLATPDGTLIPSAGKTGTTQDGKSVWFMGYTPQLATAAMIAGANEKGQPISLAGQVIAGAYHSVSGSGFAGPMWADAMHQVDDHLKPIDFVKPSGLDVRGLKMEVPDVSGQSIDDATTELQDAGFNVAYGGRRSSKRDAGTVAYSYPAAAQDAASGSTITLYESNGRRG